MSYEGLDGYASAGLFLGWLNGSALARFAW